MLADNVEDGACENPHPFTIESCVFFVCFLSFLAELGIVFGGREREREQGGGGGGRRERRNVQKFTLNIFYPSLRNSVLYTLFHWGGGGGGGGKSKREREVGGGGGGKEIALKNSLSRISKAVFFFF